MLILIPLAIVAVLAIWFIWHKSVKTIYTVPAALECWQNSIVDDRTWAFLHVPGLEDPIMVKMSTKHYSGVFSYDACPVVVKKRPLCEPWIDEITWPDGQLEKPGQEFAGMIPGLLLLALGAAALFATLKLELGHAGYLEGALALAAAGFAASYSRFSGEVLRKAPLQLLNRFNFGSGVLGKVAAALILGAITLACYWTPGFWMLFPGINASFEFGGMIALVVVSLCHRSTDTPNGSASA